MNDNTQQLNFSVSIDELNFVLQALQELPAKVCNPLTNKLIEQTNAQLTPPENTKS